jgi:hypothetical protein
MTCTRLPAGGPARADNKKTPETIMSVHRSLAAALWLLAAAGAYAAAVSWAEDAQTGKLQPWVLVVVFWSAAAVSVAIHHLSRYLADHLAQAPGLLRRSRRHLAQRRHLLSWLHLPRGRHALDRPRLHLARGRDVVRRVWPYLAQGRDALRRVWGQHGAAANAAPPLG